MFSLVKILDICAFSLIKYIKGIINMKMMKKLAMNLKYFDLLL